MWVSKWGSSGLAFLTGPPDGPADFSRANVLDRAERIAAEAATLLAGRAALLGLRRGGRVSAGGATRLLAARDGWCAITLSRPDDVAAVPALLHADNVPADPWPTLQHWVAAQPVSAVVERAALLDIPAAALGEVAAAAPRTRSLGPKADNADLLVADLSSMWAGPLCGHLLARSGATVVKVESPGARRHPGRRSPVLRLDQRRQAFLLSRFRPPGRRAARTAGRRRRRHRGLPAGGAGTAPARAGPDRAARRAGLVAHHRV